VATLQTNGSLLFQKIFTQWRDSKDYGFNGEERILTKSISKSFKTTKGDKRRLQQKNINDLTFLITDPKLQSL
jgi:hypothetical protein